MHYWKTDEDARPLGPGNEGMKVVLFYSSKKPDHERLLARFAQRTLPRHLPRVALDVEGAPETARWFGINETPALAVISDGALLSMEHRCEEGVCGQLIDFATQQHSSMEAGRYAASNAGR